MGSQDPFTLASLGGRATVQQSLIVELVEKRQSQASPTLLEFPAL